MVNRRQLVAILAVSLLLIAAFAWISLFPREIMDAADLELIRIIKDDDVEMSLSMVDYESETYKTLSVRLPQLVKEDLRALLSGPRADFDPRFLRKSAPLGMIDISSRSGTHRLEWHVGIIVDPRGDSSRVWSGRGPVAMTHADLDYEGARDARRVTALVTVWEKDAQSRRSELRNLQGVGSKK